MAPFITLKVNDTEHKIDVDPNVFTAGELNGVELNTGMQWVEWMKKLADPSVSSLAWTALAWVAVRRAGAFTPFDEFADSIKIWELVGSVDHDEVAPAATAASKRKRAT